jgi:hypothetical protein
MLSFLFIVELSVLQMFNEIVVLLEGPVPDRNLFWSRCFDPSSWARHLTKILQRTNTLYIKLILSTLLIQELGYYCRVNVYSQLILH